MSFPSSHPSQVLSSTPRGTWPILSWPTRAQECHRRGEKASDAQSNPDIYLILRAGGYGKRIDPSAPVKTTSNRDGILYAFGTADGRTAMPLLPTPSQNDNQFIEDQDTFHGILAQYSDLQDSTQMQVGQGRTEIVSRESVRGRVFFIKEDPVLGLPHAKNDLVVVEIVDENDTVFTTTHSRSVHSRRIAYSSTSGDTKTFTSFGGYGIIDHEFFRQADCFRQPEAARSAGLVAGTSKNIVAVYMDVRHVGRRAIIKITSRGRYDPHLEAAYSQLEKVIAIPSTELMVGTSGTKPPLFDFPFIIYTPLLILFIVFTLAKTLDGG
ncbi:hypothetical protein PISMIDRAFT_13602 [Pisolithus microcarpus 441]|uniref:Uncharacterized protein n=1 Tax=Pisolithus microcarpus 441 TaxID=765257 RepID=A0A0C9Y4G6_9AGAM|nr:hypothetical protein PISMIDRAFT_13602 [Pisolithus microcarpus 441]